jgi:hypothetical protein
LSLASLPSGLPRNPNVLLIRTHPNPSPSVANNLPQLNCTVNFTAEIGS